MQRQNTEEDVPVQNHYTALDLVQFEPANKHSSIGKMSLSHHATSPAYGFGTSTRARQEKLYQDKDFAKTQFFGRTSPGPNYEVRESDKFTYRDDPKYSFTKTARNCLDIAPKHAHYLRIDSDFDPASGDNSRRWNAGVTKIGLGTRFDNGTKSHRQSPGPDYNPSLKPEIPNAPKFSLGIRREVKGQSPLVSMSSTPKQVGPGSYLPMDPIVTSIMSDHAKVGFTKARKLRARDAPVDQNQTYDCRSAIGEQICSKNTTMAQISIGKAKKSVFTGVFKEMMTTQKTSIRIPHRF